MTDSARRTSRQVARGGTLLLTNVVKIAGLIFAIREVFKPDRDTSVLALSAFMMSGAQLSEEFFLSVIENFLGRPHEEPS